MTITAEGGRKLAGLTAAGQELVEQQAAAEGDPFADFTGAQAGPDLRTLVQEVRDAARQVGTAGTDAQVEDAAALLAETRRALYLILAGEARPTAAGEARPADARE